MATKITILGEEPTVKKGLNKIEFVKQVTGNKRIDIIDKAFANPKDFENIELISMAYNGGHYDIMFAYDDDRSAGIIYLGHFNDGVV